MKDYYDLYYLIINKSYDSDTWKKQLEKHF